MANLLYDLLCLPIGLGTWALARHLKFDIRTQWLLLAALALYYFNLYGSPPDLFTLDYPFHSTYIKFLAEDYWAHTWEVVGNSQAKLPSFAFYQLPFYYILAAPLYQWGAYLGMPDPMMMVQHLGMVFYLGFVFYGILTIQHIIAPTSRAYFPTLLLFLFWPIGAALGSSVHPEIASYCFEMGVIYNLLLWLSRHREGPLANAFILSGLALLFKNTGFLFLIMTGLCYAYGLWRNWRHVYSPRLIAAIAFALGCYFFSVFHYPMRSLIDADDRGDYGLLQYLHLFVYFNPIAFALDNLDGTFDVGNVFWHFFLGTLVLGTPAPLAWKSYWVPVLIRIVYMLLLAFVAIGFGVKKFPKRENQYLFYFFLLLSGVLMAATVYVRFYRPVDTQLSSARYVFPILMVLISAYATVLENYAQTGREGMVRIGTGIAMAIASLTVVLIVAQQVWFQ